MFPFPCDWFLEETTHIYKITQRCLQENAVLFSTKKSGQARNHQHINHWIQAQTVNVKFSKWNFENYFGKKLQGYYFMFYFLKQGFGWVGFFSQLIELEI